MPFPKSVKEEVLFRSGRRCCVCQEFAGRASNVHHIIQEADGGSNTINNAIALCLKCHSEAGHYNPRHPIGLKYSPDELLKHRDRWWQVVANGEQNNEPLMHKLWGVLTCSARYIHIEARNAIKDPIEHPNLKHLGLVGHIILACLTFFIFVVLLISLFILFSLNSPPLKGWRTFAAAGFLLIILYFAAFFKAETDRALVEYRKLARKKKE